MVEVYAAADWYLERAEPERPWRGILRRAPARGGPADRPSAAFLLVTDDGPIAVYAAGVEHVLAAFEGERVAALGKLVDLRPEGFDREIWIGRLDLESGGGPRGDDCSEP